MVKIGARQGDEGRVSARKHCLHTKPDGDDADDDDDDDDDDNNYDEDDADYDEDDADDDDDPYFGKMGLF